MGDGERIMSELITTKKELIEISPTKLKNLDVSIEKNTNSVLVATYFQKNIRDSESNQKDLKKWVTKVKLFNESDIYSQYLKFPLSIDGIYNISKASIIKRNITHKDTAILYFNLEDITEYSENMVSLNYIRKNLRLLEFNGIGTKFYESLTSWLAKKGYKYLIAQPKRGYEDFWEKRGQKPITKATREQKKDMNISRGLGLVYFQQLR